MSIKAVIFDYGGVICYPPPPENNAEMERLTGLPIEILLALNRKYRSEYDRGKFTSRDYYKFILSTAGVFLDDASCEKIGQTDMDGWKNLNPATVQLMREIRAAGFIMGILSNIPHDFLVWARQHIPVFSEADPAVFSCEHSMVKPEAAIYEKLKELAGCEAGELVFFDDMPDNIAKARELGINGFVWEGPEAARETLRKIGQGLERL
jgi:putative hydrolase of the HAD superfamily